MNKKGIATLFKIMLGVVIIILAMALAGPLRFFTETSRNVTTGDQVGLDCYVANGSVNSTLNPFQNANCIATDLTLPFYVWAVLGIGGAVLIAKLILQ